MAFIWQPIVPRVPQAHVVVNQARWREKESEREREGSALSFLVPDLDSDRFFHFLPWLVSHWFLIGFSLVSHWFLDVSPPQEALNARQRKQAMKRPRTGERQIHWAETPVR